MKHYRKYFPVGAKVALYVGIFSLVTFFAANCLIDAFSDTGEPQSVSHIVSIAGLTLISFVSFLYSIIHDIYRACLEQKTQPVFTWEHDIPFADREELLEETLKEISIKIAHDDQCLQKNMRFGEKNGKKSFATKLCMRLQDIKYKKEEPICFSKEAAKKIGNILLIQYSPPLETFELQLKAIFSCARWKKNIIVIINASGDPLVDWKRFADRNVLLVILNFNREAEDVLRFSDDKIVELLQKLEKTPAYAPLCEGKTEHELQKMAAKLGALSHNNIGELVELLSSKDFSLLIETDRTFMKFYRAIKAAKYDEAEKQYDQISTPPLDNLPFQYKRKFEHANLFHFLGRYCEAYEELEILLSSILLHPVFSQSASGKMLYCDTVLLQSHILKHQGEFNRATNKLNEVSEDQRDLVWIRAHFSVNIFRLNEMDTSSNKYKQVLTDLCYMMDRFKKERKFEDSIFYYYEAFYPIVKFYCSNFDHQIIPALIATEEKAIQYYAENERRYVTNCYFIKAELLRILQKWTEAKQFYEECYTIYCFNGDKDILYLVAITCKCIELFDGQTMDFGCDFDAAIAECKQQDGYGYHRRLISQMELAQHDPTFRAHWLLRYRTTINPIP